jgi:hypothetical protein
MLDFTPVRERTTTLGALVADLSIADLRDATNAQIDAVLSMIADCTDADVVFQPVDPAAKDDAAASADEANIAWTLGHVIVHTTAGGEETSFLAAELARGVANHGRSRYEVYWETVKTVAQVRQRLEESRRMRVGSLALWPDEPHLDEHVTFPFLEGPINAKAYFALGLMHEESHLAQIGEIVRQAHAARGAAI